VQICLANGAREFWVVDPERLQVKVTTPDGRSVTWHADGEIPLPFGVQARLKVDDILRR
jgi:Uma2 family endonuclease